MEQRLYETTIIVDPQLDQTRIEELVNKIQKMITDDAGSIRKVEQWGKKRMAYEIKKKRYGYYVYFLYDSNGKVLPKLEKEFRLNESIVRNLIVRLDDTALKQMEKGKITDFKKFGGFYKRHYSRSNNSDRRETRRAPEKKAVEKADTKPAEAPASE